jgi:pantoate--beta-alanine ligase
LSVEQRRQALALSRALLAVQRKAQSGEHESSKLLAEALEALAQEPGVQVDYCRIVDPDTLEDIPNVDNKGALVAVAARVGTTRLIDNLLL